jgi:hypothetical protein
MGEVLGVSTAGMASLLQPYKATLFCLDSKCDLMFANKTWSGFLLAAIPEHILVNSGDF